MGTDFIDYFLTEVYSGLEDIAKVIDNEEAAIVENKEKKDEQTDNSKL